MIEIPYNKLKDRVLRGVIKDYILQEGTDYGPKEYSLDQKIAQVLCQLSSGDAKILFDEKTGTCNLVLVSSLKNCK